MASLTNPFLAKCLSFRPKYMGYSLPKGKTQLPNQPRSISFKRSALINFTSLPRFCSTSTVPNPIIYKETPTEKLANVGKVRPKGETSRFFKKVTVVQVSKGYEVEVDGYVITSKKGERIVFPNESLATMVAADWEFMHKKVDLRRMPMYTLASLATDMTDELRQMHCMTIKLVYQDDILATRTEKPTAELKHLWSVCHDPVISWFEKEFNVDFNVDAVLETRQPRMAVRRFSKAIESLDNWALVALVTNVDTTLSLPLSLALWNGIVTPLQASRASRAEHVVNEVSWGDVPGDTDTRRLQYLMDLQSSTLFLRTLPTPSIDGKFVEQAWASSKKTQAGEDAT